MDQNTQVLSSHCMTPSHIKFYNEALDAIEANSLPLAKIAVENSLAEEPYDIESWKLYVIILNALGFDEEASKATARLETLGVTEADRLHLQIVEFEEYWSLYGSNNNLSKSLKMRERPSWDSS